ncbi:MAG: hypothetical protein NTU80_11665 [Verrucomicrobia bacterium]|nr:hypothetical protein [Verrucomicrobiota bacterium]
MPNAHSLPLRISAQFGISPTRATPPATQPPKPGTSLSRSFGCCPS